MYQLTPDKTTPSSSSRTVACLSYPHFELTTNRGIVPHRSQEEIPTCKQAYHQVRGHRVHGAPSVFMSSCSNRLNSTLSVRIEELNAQISTLYVENLRLRASEIALSSQLKKERERSRKIIADAEAAVSIAVISLCSLTHVVPVDTQSHQTTGTYPQDFQRATLPES